MTATNELRDLRNLSEQSLSLVIKGWRENEGLSDDQIVEKIATTFLSVAVLKALGGYRQPAAKLVLKARSEPLPNTVRGAVVGAMLRGGLIGAVEKNAFDPDTPEQRIRKAREDRIMNPDMRERIRNKARELGTEIK